MTMTVEQVFKMGKDWWINKADSLRKERDEAIEVIENIPFLPKEAKKFLAKIKETK